MSLTPAHDEIEARKIRDAVEKCGKNMGPHDYVPIEWYSRGEVKRVTRMLCRVCFAHVNMSTLIAHYRDVSYV